MTYQIALKSAETKLRKAGIATARLDSLLLLEFATHKDKTWLLAHNEAGFDTRPLKTFTQLIEKRCQHVPLVYLTGAKEFYGLDFTVNPAVLIPRPESERLVELALAAFPASRPAKVLDVGTGSGALAIAIAKNRPKWQISATDISAPALQVAKANVNANDIKVDFIKSDLLADISGSFDLVVANLPYIPTGSEQLNPEAKHEPELALLAGPEGLDIYRRFFAQISPHLNPDAYVIIEANKEQHPELIHLAKKAKLELVTNEKFVLQFQNEKNLTTTY